MKRELRACAPLHSSGIRDVYVAGRDIGKMTKVLEGVAFLSSTFFTTKTYQNRISMCWAQTVDPLQTGSRDLSIGAR